MITRPIYGIIGGMGPSSSAEFVHYIYSQCAGKFPSERYFPRIVLVSDSLAPDRYLSFKNDNFDVLGKYIETTIKNLNFMGVDKIMICCLVAHACLKTMDNHLVKNVVKMTDLIEENIKNLNENVVLLSTSMFYQLKLIKHEGIIYIKEIEEVNTFISKLKVSERQEDFIDFIKFMEKILFKYQANNVVFACSDLHLCNQFIKKNKIPITFNIIDAIDLAASYILADKQESPYVV